MTDTRERIAGHVEENPGVHFSELVRDLDLAPGQVQYHLRRLDVSGTELFGRTHYFPPDYDAFDRRVVAAARRETARDVLVVLLERGPTAPTTVADDLGIARSTLEWHVDRLVDVGLVEKTRDRRGRVTLSLTCRDETLELLDTVDPDLRDRFVDRFGRLLDDLLES